MTTEEDQPGQNQRRSLSPYHQKCFPPYCDSAGQVDKQVVTKMTRTDLEDRYIIFADENLALKKQLRIHEYQIQRLQTAVARQDSINKRVGKIPASTHFDNNRVEILEAQNKHLQSKIKVLKQQLMNHSYIHSKDSRLADLKDKMRSKDLSFQDFRSMSQTPSARDYKGKDESPTRDVSTMDLKEQIKELEKMLESQKKKYDAQIAQLEKELAEASKNKPNLHKELSDHSAKVNDNLEIIRLKRLNDKQAADIELLTKQFEDLQKELDKYKAGLKNKPDDLDKKSGKEDQDIPKCESHINTIKKLEDQVKDLQGMNDDLQDEVEQLKEKLLSAPIPMKKCESHIYTIKDLEKQVEDMKDKNYELQKKLEEEREKSMEAQKYVTKTVSHSETIRALEEQVRDLQKERQTLKDANNQLLQLTQSKSEKGSQTSKLQHQISRLESRLEDKINELEEKEEQLIKMECLIKEMQESGKLTPAESVKSRPESKTAFKLDSPSHQEVVKENEKLRIQLDEMCRKQEKCQQQLQSALQEINDLQNKKSHTDSRSPSKPQSNSSSRHQSFPSSRTQLDPVTAKKSHSDSRSPSKPQSNSSSGHQSLPTSRTQSTPVSKISSASGSTSRTSDTSTTEEGTQACEDYSESSVHSKSSSSSKKTDFKKLKDQLCDALIENQKLRNALENCDGVKERDPSEFEENDRVDKKLRDALYEVERLRSIAAEHEKCSKRRRSSSSSSHLRPERDKSQYPPCEKNYPPPSIKSAHPPSTKSYHSVHRFEEVPVASEPAKKPNLYIVSKHEFDQILLNKKKYYSETEVTSPVKGDKIYHCKLEICVHDLELDKMMLDYLRSLEKDPQIYVYWNFVGLEQRTASKPAHYALFSTNVAYYGPLTEDITEYVKEREMPMYLMLEKSNGKQHQVGEGKLDITPAMFNANRGFLRTVNLYGNQGSATMYCSFKLHDCSCDQLDDGAESLEVAIGHLYLRNYDAGQPHATHLYVEYSLLGHCGPELETDSVPKQEVMYFNHSKRMKVNEENLSHLIPMIRERRTQPLRFNVLAEPCNLVSDTEVEEFGYADVNLLEEMVEKQQDIVSAQVPVYSKTGEDLGTLSVTIIGLETLQNVSEEHKHR